MLNLGSTSSQISVYENEDEIASISISHTLEELNANPGIDGQFKMRKQIIEKVLAEKNFVFESFDAICKFS